MTSITLNEVEQSAKVLFGLQESMGQVVQSCPIRCTSLLRACLRYTERASKLPLLSPSWVSLSGVFWVTSALVLWVVTVRVSYGDIAEMRRARKGIVILVQMFLFFRKWGHSRQEWANWVVERNEVGPGIPSLWWFFLSIVFDVTRCFGETMNEVCPFRTPRPLKTRVSRVHWSDMLCCSVESCRMAPFTWVIVILATPLMVINVVYSNMILNWI